MKWILCVAFQYLYYLFIMVIDDNLNPYMRIFLSDPEGMALIVPDYNSQGLLSEFYLHTKDVNVQPH